jgi:uncharacterized protein (UPF0261 family)
MAAGPLKPRTILLIGTADTKADELLYMKRCLSEAGGSALVMDVGVLGTPPFTPEQRNVDVAAAAGTTLEAIAALGDENLAMTKMAAGAVGVARRLHAAGEIHGVLALGGTMGTDLALDVTAALPLGLPKLIVTTVAYSHLIPPERLAPDLMMILWAGGLYGLNSVCRTILSQAAGAILGACAAPVPSAATRPLIGISSLGKSCLNYMVELTPALAARGYECAVFHSTGMGGRALEALAAQDRFAAVFDLAMQEVANEANGSVVTAGPHRLETAGARGIPQICAPGASDMIDLQSWREIPGRYAGRPYHAHNRLLGSVSMSTEERRATARLVMRKLAHASGPTAFLLPLKGIEAWDRPGEPLHDPEGLAAFIDEVRRCARGRIEFVELDCHINDPEFVTAALAIFDRWVAEGRVRPGTPGARA